jgi:GntR family transcriptional regulator
MTSSAKDPKYLIIAKTLKARIAASEYEVGSLLPTESNFSEEFSASKQTIRNAISLLQQWGLTFTRRGSGTIVRSKGGSEQYIQNAGGMAELIQQGKQAQIHRIEHQQTQLNSRDAKLIHSTPGEIWWRVGAIRKQESDQKPDALLYLFFRESHRGLIDLLTESPSTLIHALLQEGYGEVVQEVAQEISPVVISGINATRLEVEPGAAGLQVVRRYYGAHKKLIWSAIIYHPPGHSYSSWFSRQITPSSDTSS